MKYRALWSRIKHRIIKRDKCCKVCGSAEDLTVHHIIERRNGGSNDDENLMTVCQTCHRKIHAE